MAAKPPSPKSAETPKPDGRDALIQRQVLLALGEPSGLHMVRVHRLWENCYRVNVLVGFGADPTKVANSFFLRTDGDGTILHSTPGIVKQYH